MNSATLAEIQSIIDSRIAPAAALGFALAGYDGRRLQLRAPLAPNRNHHGTAFGGSLFALGAVCGWGFVLLKLREAGLDGHIVVASSEVDYLAPVTGELHVSCGAEAEAVTRFLRALRRDRRARLSVTGEAPAGGGACALRLRSCYAVSGADGRGDR